MDGDIEKRFRNWIEENCKQEFLLGIITLEKAWRRFIKTNVVSWCEVICSPKNKIKDKVCRWKCPNCKTSSVVEHLCNSNRMIVVAYSPVSNWKDVKESNKNTWTYMGFSCANCGYMLSNEEEMVIIDESGE